MDAKGTKFLLNLLEIFRRQIAESMMAILMDRVKLCAMNQGRFESLKESLSMSSSSLMLTCIVILSIAYQEVVRESCTLYKLRFVLLYCLTRNCSNPLISISFHP